MRTWSVGGWFLVGVLQLALAAACQKKGEVTLELHRTIEVDGGRVTAAAFSPDGNALAMASDLGELRVVDMPSQVVRWNAVPGDHWVGTLEFSPDSSLVAYRGRHLTVHEAATGKEVFRAHHAGPSGFAWHKDGQRFAYSFGREVVVRDGKRDRTWASFEYPVNAVSWAPKGGLMVGDNVGRLWHVPEADIEPVLRMDHRAERSGMVRMVAVVTAGGSVFDLASNGVLRRDEQALPNVGTVFAFSVTPDGESFAVGGNGKHVRWWSGAGKESRDVAVPASVAALALHPDGGSLFLSTYEGGRGIYRADKEPVAVVGMPARIRGTAMSPDGTLVAVRTHGWTLHRVSDGSAQPIANAESVVPGRRGAEFLVQEKERVVLLEGRSHTELGSIASHHSLFNQNAAGPSNLLYVDGAVVALDGKEVLEMPEGVLMHNYVAVASASDGSWAIGGVAGIEGDLGGLVVTDSSGKLRGTMDDAPVFTVAFSPDNSRIYCGCATGMSAGMGPLGRELRVLDAHTLDPIETINASVSDWRFLNAQRALVCSKQKLQVWDVETLQPVQDIALDGPCYGFELSEDRQMLKIAGRREVRLYRVRVH